MKKNNKAFTIVELLVVVAIMGLLASIMLVAIKNAREKGKYAAVLQYAAGVKHVLGAYILGEWKFENEGATVKDQSGNGKNMTFTNSAYIKNDVSELGWAGSFNGSSTYGDITFDSTSAIPVPQMVIEFWFYISQSDKNLIRYMMDARVNGLGNWYILQSYNPNGTGNINFNNLAKVNPTDWTAGQWNHIVIAVKSTASKIYINGVLKASGSGFSPTLGILRVGSRASSLGEYFKGAIDELKIYNEAMDLAEIQQLYAEGAPRHGLAVQQ